MQLRGEHINKVCAESEIWDELLNLDEADILELGCGAAELTRQIATSSIGCWVTAMKVDETQHAKNLQQSDLSNVHFITGGAEAIPAEDGRFIVADEMFFFSPISFGDFSEFEEKVIGVSHTQHELSEAVHNSVRQAFNMAMTDDGVHFLMPRRVDLLKVVK